MHTSPTAARLHVLVTMGGCLLLLGAAFSCYSKEQVTFGWFWGTCAHGVSSNGLDGQAHQTGLSPRCPHAGLGGCLHAVGACVQVYAASAAMEWAGERNEAIPRNIFELGLKAHIGAPGTG